MSGILKKVFIVNRFIFSLIAGICILWGLRTIFTGEAGPGLMAIILGTLCIWFTRWMFGRLLRELAITKANPEPDAASSDEKITRLYDEFSSGKFPVIANPPVNLKAGEVAHHVCPVEVRQFRDRDHNL